MSLSRGGDLREIGRGEVTGLTLVFMESIEVEYLSKSFHAFVDDLSGSLIKNQPYFNFSTIAPRDHY